MNEFYERQMDGWLVLVSIVLGMFLATACATEKVEQSEEAAVVSAEDDQDDWDATAAFLAGVFTIANADSLNSTVFQDNFRANYDWIHTIFLPHLLDTPKHPWWDCDEYCIKTAKLLAKGDKKREKELMESLARYKLHERERPKSH